MNIHHTSAIALLSAIALIGCASPNYSDPGANRYPQSYPQSSSTPAYNNYYGVIDSIQVVQQAPDNRGVGVGGAVAGGVVGGLLGNQVGKGSGRTAATAAGVVGGALVGSSIQRNNQPVRQLYQVNVRLDNGGYQSYTMENVADLRAGDRVRVENGRITRY
ncbi:glycine zipper 2TM domain-containing protein [Herminiimonas fonticola]|uniref:glycine zipper 2TM domain-containing protein n=1 Tax=Herminiimonas fonticola TaxID=303380 RepID=UPI00333F3079